MAMARGFPSPRASPKRSSSYGVPPLDGNPHRCVGWYIPWTNPFPLLLNLPPNNKNYGPSPIWGGISWRIFDISTQNKTVNGVFTIGLLVYYHFPHPYSHLGVKKPDGTPLSEAPPAAAGSRPGSGPSDRIGRTRRDPGSCDTSKKVAESTGDQWIEMVVPPFENAFSWWT